MTAIIQLEPASVALDLRLAREQLTDPVPRVLAKSSHVVQQLVVLKNTIETIRVKIRAQSVVKQPSCLLAAAALYTYLSLGPIDLVLGIFLSSLLHLLYVMLLLLQLLEVIRNTGAIFGR